MASLRWHTPCDEKDENGNHVCPYGAEYGGDCEYWCGAEEPQDNYEMWEEKEEEEES